MINRLKDLLKKKSAQNGIWLYGLQFFNFVIPLLTLPYITRILGKSSYGTFSIALNIVTYLQVIVEYGFGMSATRKVAINDNENHNKLFTSVVLGRVFLLTLCAFISVVYVCLNISNKQLCFSYLILTICLLGYCVQMNWVFQGLQEMKYISIVNILGRTISTVLIFLLVKTSNDLYLYCLLYSISPFLSGFIGLIIAKHKYKLRFVKVSIKDVGNELRNGFYVFTTQLSSKIFGSIGVTFLGIYATSSIVGVYSAIQKIPNVMVLLWAPIAQVIYPIVSRHFNNDFYEGFSFILKIKKRVMPIFILFALLIGIFGKFIVGLLFGSEYSPYYYWLWPLLGWLIVSIDNNFMGIQILIGSGHDKEYGRAFWIGVLFTVIVNFVFIRFGEGNGAAIAPLISEIILNCLLRCNIRLIKKNYKVQ